MKARDIRNIALGAVAASGLSALAAVNLTNFTPGTPIKSSEVNANFSSLNAAITALELPVGVSRLAVTGTAADGKVLKLQAGKLNWGDDIVGNGGGTFTADGSSLSLSGTTFSVRENGITTSKIADGSVTDAKITDGSVTRVKIADGSVTAGKINLPLNLSVSSGAPVISANNSSGIGLVGSSTGAAGVVGSSETNVGVRATSSTNAGMAASSKSGPGVQGTSESGIGVYGTSSSSSALFGENNNNAEVLRLVQRGTGALIDAHGPNGNTVFSVDNKGNVFSATNSYSSDRRLKTNFVRLDSRDVLEKIAGMPVTRWNYKTDSSSVQHIGPMAQDFHAAFSLSGTDDTHINAVDANGVALAAIQGLNAKLETDNAALRAVLTALEARLKRLENGAHPR